MRNFAVPDVVRQGWYLLGSARKLGEGHVQDGELGSRRLCRIETSTGAPMQCLIAVHISAAISPWRMSRRTAFVASSMAGAGAPTDSAWMRQGTRSCRTGVCVTTPMSSAGDFCGRSWGIVQPLNLPDVPSHLGRGIVLAPQRVGAHPDVIFSSGFDLAHFGPSHGIDAHTESARR
jgi:hypothetical protein